MVGLKLKGAFQFNSKISNKLSGEDKSKGKISSYTRFSKELHSTDCNSLQPLLTLLNLQSNKSYYEGSIASGMLVRFSDNEGMEVERISLIGTSLKFYLKNDSMNTFENQVAELNINVLWEHSIEENDDSYGLEFTGSAFSFLCTDHMYVKQLSKAISLAQFEYGSLWKALTASIISLMGFKISDIHLILNNNYSFKDWCFIKVRNEWVKAWCHIDKRSKVGESKGKLRIKFYKDDKSTSKKNLICYISDASGVEDVFLGTEPGRSIDHNEGNWDLDQLKTMSQSGVSSVTTMETVLASVTTVGIIGRVHWTKDSLTDSPTSSRSRSSSLVWAPKSPRKRVVSMGERSAHKHSRNVSLISTSSSTQNFDDDDFELTNERFLFKPVPHSGVYHLETIIRFLIPLFDCLQLYGRPTAFKFEREDVDSLSFGLPRLPTIDYFSYDELLTLQNMVIPDSDTVGRWSFFKCFLRDCYLDPDRQKMQRFAKLADQNNYPRVLSKIQLETPFTELNDETPLTGNCSSTPSMI